MKPDHLEIPARDKEHGVEGLRGFAALLVLYTHFLWPFDLDPGYSLPDGWKILEASQGAVLLFFILSGYVIGLTNSRPLDSGSFRAYIARRLVRLVPLAWLAIALSVPVKPVDDTFTVLGNLVFLQNQIPYGELRISPLEANSNLWSLNYEILYYLSFVFIWWHPRLWFVWACAALTVGIVGWALPGHWAALITCYAMGWLFWLIGYGLSRLPAPQKSATVNPLPWVSLLLFWFVTWQAKPLWNLCRRLDILPPDSLGWINYSFVDILPSSILLLLAASGRHIPYSRYLCLVAAFSPLGFLAWNTLRGRTPWDPLDPHLVFCALACALWRWRPDGVRAWAILAPVGAISYGLYILQRPAQWFVHGSDWLPSGSLFTYLLRLALALALTITLAYWAEKKLQPWLRARLIRASSA